MHAIARCMTPGGWLGRANLRLKSQGTKTEKGMTWMQDKFFWWLLWRY